MNAPRQLRDFTPLVLPYAQSCPIPTVEQAVRMAAIEWCERTRCWRAITTVEIAEQGQTIVAPDYAAIHEFETAHFGDDQRPLAPAQYSELDPEDADGTGEPGQPDYITQLSPNTITVVPFQTGTLRLSLFLKPRSGPEFGANGAGGTLQGDQNVLPEHIFVQDAEAIAQGALHRILMMPNTPWTNLKLASFYLDRFNQRADAKFTTQIKGQQRARARTRPKWF